MGTKGWREVWEEGRLGYSPDFRAQIDRIVAGLENVEDS
jgi:hypothetical protein